MSIYSAFPYTRLHSLSFASNTYPQRQEPKAPVVLVSNLKSPHAPPEAVRLCLAWSTGLPLAFKASNAASALFCTTASCSAFV